MFSETGKVSGAVFRLSQLEKERVAPELSDTQNTKLVQTITKTYINNDSYTKKNYSFQKPSKLSLILLFLRLNESR